MTKRRRGCAERDVMKRFCFGSYIKVLTQCKSAVGKSQKNICGTIVISVAPSYDLRTDDGKASDLILCRSNLPQDVVESANAVDKNALTDYFKANVLDLVDSNKKSDVVLAIKDIIANDESIKPDTVVDKVAGLTKAELSETATFVFENFLAGVFLYTATVVANTEGKDSVKAIDEGYMKQFSGRDSEINFVGSTENARSADYDKNEAYTQDGQSENVDGVHIGNDFVPNLQQNIYNQTISVNSDGNVVNGFVFNVNRG